MSDLGTLEGLPCSAAFAINSGGQIVGSANDCVSVEHAFLWQDGHMIDLNVFVPPDYGLLLEEADFINDRGDIIGYAALANGDEEAFLLVPCDPDPREGCQDQTANAGGAAAEKNPASSSETLSTSSRGGVAAGENLTMIGTRLSRRHRFASHGARIRFVH